MCSTADLMELELASLDVRVGSWEIQSASTESLKGASLEDGARRISQIGSNGAPQPRRRVLGSPRAETEAAYLHVGSRLLLPSEGRCRLGGRSRP